MSAVRVLVGFDWGEERHGVVVLDASSGEVLVEEVLDAGFDGLTRFHELLGSVCADPGGVVVCSETDRGLWITAMLGAGYRVLEVNPLSSSRYRDRYRVSGAKSDLSDARVLAEVARGDRHLHREVAGDSVAVSALKVLTRAHQRLVWDRLRVANRVRSGLVQYFPAALGVFDDLKHGDAVGVLAVGASPVTAATLTKSQIRGALRKGGRQRYLDRRAEEIRDAFRDPAFLADRTAVGEAFASEVTALVAQLAVLNTQIGVLETELATHFEKHPSAEIYRSMPGCGVLTSARMLGEFGDDPERYDDVKSRRNFAGVSPIEKQSGKMTLVRYRWNQNRYMASTTDQWAFAAIRHSPGAKAFYWRRRQLGDMHHTALRALASKLTGQLHGCLKTGKPYNEQQAWQHRNNQNHINTDTTFLKKHPAAA